MTNVPIIVLGAGGHAKVVIDGLLKCGHHLVGVTDPDTKDKMILGIPVLGDDNALVEHTPDAVQLAMGVGSTRVSNKRKTLFLKFITQGYKFVTLGHPSAAVATETTISHGAQIMAVNTGAQIDHGSSVAAHCHVAPGAVLGGDVSVSERCHIGAGATIIQVITIGAGALVAAGATVIGDVKTGARVAGTPARAF